MSDIGLFVKLPKKFGPAKAEPSLCTSVGRLEQYTADGLGLDTGLEPKILYTVDDFLPLMASYVCSSNAGAAIHKFGSKVGILLDETKTVISLL